MLILVATLMLVVAGGAQDTGGFYVGPPSINKDSDGQCTDNKGQGIPEGLLFTPGPDECQVCTCLMKMPVLCRTVLCAPPKNCLSLRVGDACCQWICDEWDTPRSGNDIGLRLVASAITAVFSLALLFFLIYRLRQRKLRGRQNHMEAESYNSAVGDQDDCWNGGDPQVSAFPSGWIKETTFTRPFPPTYDEAMQMQSMEGDNRVAAVSLGQVEEEGDEVPAPPYHSITQDPVIPYPVATLGRLVLPPTDFLSNESRTLPAVLRGIRRGGQRCPPHLDEGIVSECQEGDGEVPHRARVRMRSMQSRSRICSSSAEDLCGEPPSSAPLRTASVDCRPENERIMSSASSPAESPGVAHPGLREDAASSEARSESGPSRGQSEQRISYLSQSDFHPAGSGGVLQTAV